MPFISNGITSSDINLKVENKIINTDRISNTKLIDDDINNFIPKRSNVSALDNDLIERKQRIKRRKLNLSTIDYTTEKFVDIKSCKSNYHKLRLNKNKVYSKNTKIIGFLNNNIEEENGIENYDESIDKYDQFWVLKENQQLIFGSWKR